MADHEEVKRLKQLWPTAKAIEMEGAGIAAALDQTTGNAPAFVIVKSISDFADSCKDDKWQSYAAYASASFVLHFLISSENA